MRSFSITYFDDSDGQCAKATKQIIQKNVNWHHSFYLAIVVRVQTTARHKSFKNYELVPFVFCGGRICVGDASSSME